MLYFNVFNVFMSYLQNTFYGSHFIIFLLILMNFGVILHLFASAFFTSVVLLCIQELNVKIVTTSNDKEKYGLKLKADLDFQRLGKRLKQDFKKVQKAIKGTHYFYNRITICNRFFRLSIATGGEHITTSALLSVN